MKRIQRLGAVVLALTLLFSAIGQAAGIKNPLPAGKKESVIPGIKSSPGSDRLPGKGIEEAGSVARREKKETVMEALSRKTGTAVILQSGTPASLPEEIRKKPEDVRQEIQGKHVKGAGKKPLNKKYILPANYKEVTIFGAAEATKNQAAQLIHSRNPGLDIGCSVGEIVELYWTEAGREGIRPDMALAQALVETGYFHFGGDVQAWQHNFCGLGTTGGGVRGAAFKTPQDGVRAHIQHLKAYASHERPKTPLLDPRYDSAHRLRVQNGLITRWSGLNWTWAMGGEYAEKIFTAQQKMLQQKDSPPPDMWKEYRNREKEFEKLYERKMKYETKKQASVGNRPVSERRGGKVSKSAAGLKAAADKRVKGS